MAPDLFEPWLEKWQMARDGQPWTTHSSHLLPVQFEGVAAVLKIAQDSEEIRGGRLLDWWNGNGAARLLASEANAFVMERAQGTESLMDMALHGNDDEASRIACRTIARLHTHTNIDRPVPELVSLQIWFRELTDINHDSAILQTCARQARRLLARPQDSTVIHGDIHHDNILDFADRGWLAIDPKGLFGERGFDYANLIVNPDLPTVTNPLRFERQIHIIADAAQLNIQRLLAWVLAFAGLSAVWFMQDGNEQQAKQDLEVAHLAAGALQLHPD